MKRYGQFCPVAKAAEVFCERWTPLIVRDLALGATRFSELQRGVPLASPSLLSARLKQLQREGIIERRRSESGNSWTYHLTAAGEELVPMVYALGTWGQRWSRRDLDDNEVDLGLLLWALERGAHPDAFGNGRTVIELTITDQIETKRNWWYRNEAGSCELCLTAPDSDIDLYVEATLRDLIRVWRGDLKLARALDTERLKAHGSAKARKAFPEWFAVNPLADTEPAAMINA